MLRFLVINGPNLDQLGTRQPEMYGKRTLEEINQGLSRFASAHAVELEFRQTGSESELLSWLHQVPDQVSGIVLNPGAFTHTSRALGDAVSANPLPLVEVHISNVVEREEWRRQSVLQPLFRVYGRGSSGYQWAILHLLNHNLIPATEVAYGALPDQILDWRPNAEARKLVVLLHGGLWRHEWERDTIESLAVDLNQHGFATANIEYRRVGLGGGWPESFEDVALALAKMPDLTGFSPQDTIVLGHSAGATMALWADHPGLSVALAPFTDLVAARTSPSLSRVLEEPLPEPAQYSPVHRLPRSGTALVAASPADEIVPYEPVVSYFEKARSLRDSVEFLTVDADHFDFLKPSSTAWGLVRERLKPRNPS